MKMVDQAGIMEGDFEITLVTGLKNTDTLGSAIPSKGLRPKSLKG